MTTWERFELAWRFFWFGLITGVAIMLFRSGWPEPSVPLLIWSCFAWILMFLPSWGKTLISRFRSVPPPSAAG